MEGMYMLKVISIKKNVGFKGLIKPGDEVNTVHTLLQT